MHRKWWTLIVVSVATFMLLLDITVVNTALPAIEEDLGASFTELQWVIDAYTLSLAALVLTALKDKVDVGRMRAVGFCVSVQHAEFMAESFRRAGIASQATSQGSTSGRAP